MIDKPNYIIVTNDEDYTEHFLEEVNDRINEGCKPLGGIAVRHGATRGARLIQAMIQENFSVTR